MPQIVICQELSASSKVGEFLAESLQQEDLISKTKTPKLSRGCIYPSMNQ